VTTPRFDPAKPTEVDKNLRELSRRIAAQLDERTRNDLHDFIVALACDSKVEQTGMWLFALMRAMKPLTESETE
jgi:hypothetical protein